MKKNLSKKIILGVLGIIVFVGLFYYVNQYLSRFFASGETVKVNLSPLAQAKKINDEMVINVDFSGQKISATELYVTYDSKYLDYYTDYNVGSTSSGVTSLNNYFQEPLISEVTNVGASSPGMKQLKLVLVSLNTPSNTDVVQVHLRFKAKVAGETVVSLLKDKTTVTGSNASNQATYYDINSLNPNSKVTISDTDSPTVTITDSPDITPTVTLTPTPTQVIPSGAKRGNATVDIKVRFQGVSGEPKQTVIPVEVAIGYSASDYNTQKVDFTYQGSGVWKGTASVDNIYSESYYNIYIKGPKHLRKKICDQTPTESVGGTYKCNRYNLQLETGANELDFTGIILLAGDIPVQDSLISALDLAFVRQNFGNKSPDALDRGDLNFDGIIDTQDFSMILQTLAFKYDED